MNRERRRLLRRPLAEFGDHLRTAYDARATGPGPVDTDAAADAVIATVEAHPMLAAAIGSDGIEAATRALVEELIPYR